MSVEAIISGAFMQVQIRSFLIILYSVTSLCAQSHFEHFITRSGHRLMDGERELRFISFNIPNLNFVEDEMAFGRAHPYGLPTGDEIRDALESVRQLGGTVVRMYTFPVRKETDDQTVPKYVLGPGKFDERSFMTMDTVLALANEAGIRLIVPLVDSWKWMGGRPQYAAFRGKKENEFRTDPQLIEDFKKTIQYVVNRKNSITGDRYRDDKAILCWETGNEVFCPHSWTHEVARTIKQYDKNHLVMDGGFIREESLADSLVDIVTSHHYSTDPSRLFSWIHRGYDQIKGRKPYIIGEFGFVGTPLIEKVLNWVVDHECSGALIWTLRYHRSAGGFYWHSEPMGRGVFKAYHWPGFESGSEYDEKGLLMLMRCKAYEIRGLPVPELPVPKAPVLLPVDNPTAISWRGSAGAAGYDVQRSVDGKKWKTVGYNISDAAVQYMPLFQDPSAKIGASYYYRVIAKNSRGESQPSNVAGPVYCAYQAWIDEMGTLIRLYFQEGEWTVDTRNCRQFKEDMERLSADSAGCALIYRVPGPVTGYRIYSFTEEEGQNLSVSLSEDGKEYTDIQSRVVSAYSGSGEYDYWRPVRVTHQDGFETDRSRYLKITLLKKSQIGRVEVYYGTGNE